MTIPFCLFFARRELILSVPPSRRPMEVTWLFRSVEGSGLLSITRDASANQNNTNNNPREKPEKNDEHVRAQELQSTATE